MTRPPQEPVQLGDYLQLVARHWPLVAWAAAGGCLLGILLTLVQQPSYRTKTSIEIQNINGDFLNMKQVHPVSDESQGTDALIDLQTQIEVLQSASLTKAAKQAMKQSGLKREWAAHSSPMGLLFHSDNSVLTDRFLDKLADTIKVRAISQTA